MLGHALGETAAAGNGVGGAPVVPAWRGSAGPDELAAVRTLLEDAPAALLSFPGVGAADLGSVDTAAREAGLDVAWAGVTRTDEAGLERDTPLLVVAGTAGRTVRDAVATGPAGLTLDPGAPSGVPLDRPARVCVASYEVVGPTKNGGIGTANTSLAEALAGAGHDVTLLYTGYEELDRSHLHRWSGHYEARGIRFGALAFESAVEVETPHFNQARAYQLYHWLRAEEEEAGAPPYDVLHVPECQGHGYYALLARRLGHAFASTTMAVGIHSPTRWVFEANRWPMNSVHRLVDDFLERESIALADVLVSPSAYLLSWMERRGWAMPERRFVQQYVLSRSARPAAEEPESRAGESWSVEDLPDGPGTAAARDHGFAPGGAGPPPAPVAAHPDGADRPEAVRELVFFGRLETRKGLELFCDALDLLAQGDVQDFSVTFMGSETMIAGQLAGHYLLARAERWPWPVQLETNRNQHAAVEYLRAPGRLAVMPSPVDNSPNTVYEALGLGIPFLASRGGGIPELIHPLDLDAATFEPADPSARRPDPSDPTGTVPDLSPAWLADAVRRALSRDEALHPRFAVDPGDNEGVHVAWHERVAAGGAPPPAAPPAVTAGAGVSACVPADGELPGVERLLSSLRKQDDCELEVLVSLAENDESVRWSLGADLEERGWGLVRGKGSLEAARAAASAARGDWLLLCEPAAIAAPSLVATLVGAAEALDAEIVTVATSYGARRSGDPDWRGNVPLGGAPLVGLFHAFHGIGALLVRREAYERLGGLQVDGPARGRHRDLVARATLAGARIAVVPEALVQVSPNAASAVDLSPTEPVLRSLRPYRAAMPPGFEDLPAVALELSRPMSLPREPEERSPEQAERIRTLQHRLDVVATSRSWRLTRPLRAVMERRRRAR